MRLSLGVCVCVCAVQVRRLFCLDWHFIRNGAERCVMIKITLVTHINVLEIEPRVKVAKHQTLFGRCTVVNRNSTLDTVEWA